MKVVIALVTLLGLVATSRPSEACSPIGNSPFVLDAAQAGDTTPPTPITVCDWFVTTLRGGTCGHHGMIHIFPDSTDDATPVDDLGYVFHVLGEAAPEPRKLQDGALIVAFDASVPQIELVVVIKPVDLNGNEGKGMRCTVTWTNPEPVGDDSGGCASTRGSGWLAAFAIALLGLRRRRVTPA